MRPEQEARFAKLPAGASPARARQRLQPLDLVKGAGQGAIAILDHAAGLARLLGDLVIALALLPARLSLVPWREISANIYRSGAQALAITGLVGVLIGVVLSYLFALQLRTYGADMLIIRVLGIGVLRELGPLLAAILVAGRSGASIAAQIGVMRVTQELDALAVMGISRTLRLVLPKVLALTIALPLLVLWTDAAALLGGMLAANYELGVELRGIHRQSAQLRPGGQPVARGGQGGGLRDGDRAGGLPLRPAHPAEQREPGRGNDASGGRRDHPGDRAGRHLRSGFLRRGLHVNVIEIEGLWTAYGKQVVHAGIDLAVRQGEVFTLVGGSGAGKTTLLRHMLGLETPLRGEVRVFGQPPSQGSFDGWRELRRRWGVLFQGGALYSALDVFDNIALPLRELGAVDEELVRELVYRKLEQTGLARADADKKPAQLSGGMVKRVALARALILEPELLYLDEPTAGLDPARSKSFVGLIKSLRGALHLTVVMVTHDLDTLVDLSDRVGVLVNGHLVAVGTLEQIQALEDPCVHSFFLGVTGRHALAAMT